MFFRMSFFLLCNNIVRIRGKEKKIIILNFISDGIVQELLQVLCSNDLSPREHLEQQQALFRQFADILDFVLRFDDLKVNFT